MEGARHQDAEDTMQTCDKEDDDAPESCFSLPHERRKELVSLGTGGEEAREALGSPRGVGL